MIKQCLEVGDVITVNEHQQYVNCGSDINF